MSTGENNQKQYTSIEPLGLDVERDQLSTSSNGSIMSASTGECNTYFNGYQSNLMAAFVCSISSDQTLLKSDGNISNISSENEHSSMNSNISVIDESSWIHDDSDYNSAETQKELIMLLSADIEDDFERARKVIELDIGVRLIYHGKLFR